MTSDNVSPEETLFNAIQKTEGASTTKTAPKKISFDLKSTFLDFKKRIFSIEIKKHDTAFAPKEKFSLSGIGFLQGDIVHNLKLVNRVLVGLAGIAAIALVADIITPKHKTEKFYASASTLGNWQFQKEQITPLKPFTFYEEAARKRDLFNPAPKGGGELTGVKDLRLQAMVKDLNLVGIYWGERPEVMIEDTSAKKCYFLKQGDEIKGMKIQQILKDRVILEYQGKEMEFM
jgi:hypothetical protein